MIEFGKSLITAREAKGLTIEQIAEQTHMAPKTVRQLEEEDFTSFPAAIYGRGFVKLYCGAVGLEPKPFVDEFMEIYNGNRDVSIREREVPAAEPEPVEPPPRPAPAPIPTQASLLPEDPIQERPVAAEPPPPKPVGRTMPPLPEVPPPPQMSLPLGDPPEPGTLSRYAAPLHEEHARPSGGFSISPAIWRLALLALVVGGIIWAAIIGLKALHKATAGEGENREEVAKVEKAEEKVKVKGEGEVKTAEKVKVKGEGEVKAKDVDAASRRVNEKATKKPREPQKIPPLYID